MATIYKNILHILPSLKSLLFLALFLFSGNYHQALEKHDQEWEQEPDFSFLYEPVISFDKDYKAYIEQEVTHLLRRRHFNGTVMIAHKGHAVYNQSAGKANFRQNIDLEETNNVFQLASVGKQFTAMAVLMLYEQGYFDLDDPAHLYIENFPYNNITIRHMLNHTSGLQNYMYLFDRFWKQDHLPGHQDMLEMMVNRNLPLNFTPGARFSYSNTGYAFLAMLVQQLTGQSFPEFVAANIFEPLKMNDSFVFDPSLDIQDMQANGLVAGHDRSGRFMRVIPVDHIDGVTGDKGVFSSAEDLLKWDNALEMNKLVSSETKSKAFERGKLRSGYAINYGFGYRIRKQGMQDVIYHNGWWRGFRTTYLRLPENTLIVILNNTNASINGLDRQIQNILNRSPYPKFGEEEQERILASQAR